MQKQHKTIWDFFLVCLFRSIFLLSPLPAADSLLAPLTTAIQSTAERPEVDKNESSWASERESFVVIIEIGSGLHARAEPLTDCDGLYEDSERTQRREALVYQSVFNESIEITKPQASGSMYLTF